MRRKNISHYTPDGSDLENALRKTTHLGIGAHQDDLEFMAMHGIIECYEQEERWFGGITCTSGAGSARLGAFANTTDLEMQAIRAEEQKEAARVGKYAFVSQLGHSSAEIKNPGDNTLENDLKETLEATQPEVLYTHNLADKHPTHIAVAIATIKALRRLPCEMQPKKVIGCEVWRDLDWLPDDKKTIMDLSRHTELASQLNGLFASQIAGGKRYDLAVEGRRRANATFFDSHSTDEFQSVIYGMDLTPLMLDDTLTPQDYVLSLTTAFQDDVSAQLAPFS